MRVCHSFGLFSKSCGAEIRKATYNFNKKGNCHASRNAQHVRYRPRCDRLRAPADGAPLAVRAPHRIRMARTYERSGRDLQRRMVLDLQGKCSPREQDMEQRALRIAGSASRPDGKSAFRTSPILRTHDLRSVHDPAGELRPPVAHAAEERRNHVSEASARAERTSWPAPRAPTRGTSPERRTYTAL